MFCDEVAVIRTVSQSGRHKFIFMSKKLFSAKTPRYIVIHSVEREKWSSNAVVLTKVINFTEPRTTLKLVIPNRLSKLIRTRVAWVRSTVADIRCLSNNGKYPYIQARRSLSLGNSVYTFSISYNTLSALSRMVEWNGRVQVVLWDDEYNNFVTLVRKPHFISTANRYHVSIPKSFVVNLLGSAPPKIVLPVKVFPLAG